MNRSLFPVVLEEVLLQFGVLLDTAVHASRILGELVLEASNDDVHLSILALPFAQQLLYLPDVDVFILLLAEVRPELRRTYLNVNFLRESESMFSISRIRYNSRFFSLWLRMSISYFSFSFLLKRYR